MTHTTVPRMPRALKNDLIETLRLADLDGKSPLRLVKYYEIFLMRKGYLFSQREVIFQTPNQEAFQILVDEATSHGVELQTTSFDVVESKATGEQFFMRSAKGVICPHLSKVDARVVSFIQDLVRRKQYIDERKNRRRDNTPTTEVHSQDADKIETGPTEETHNEP